jgi:ABC-type lipoprotein export system ATPase subunit
MLADEPTGELDSTTAREIPGMFRRIVKELLDAILKPNSGGFHNEPGSRR